jgi:hypothetical protein
MNVTFGYSKRQLFVSFLHSCLQIAALFLHTNISFVLQLAT